MKIDFLGCFDPDCCGGVAFGYVAKCEKCGSVYIENADENLCASDLYDEFYKYRGKELIFKCTGCSAMYKATLGEWDSLDELDFKLFS